MERFKVIYPWVLLVMSTIVIVVTLAGCATLRQDIESSKLQHEAVVIKSQLDAKSSAWNERVSHDVAECRALALPTVEARSACIGPTERVVVDIVAPAVETAVVELRAFWLAEGLGLPVAETRPHVDAAREAVDSIPAAMGGGAK